MPRLPNILDDQFFSSCDQIKLPEIPKLQLRSSNPPLLSKWSHTRLQACNNYWINPYKLYHIWFNVTAYNIYLIIYIFNQNKILQLYKSTLCVVYFIDLDYQTDFHMGDMIWLISYEPYHMASINIYHYKFVWKLFLMHEIDDYMHPTVPIHHKFINTQSLVLIKEQLHMNFLHKTFKPWNGKLL